MHVFDLLFRHIQNLTLLSRTLLLSSVGWGVALCCLVIHCTVYTAYVDGSLQGVLGALLWVLQENGFWLLLTPVLFISLSHVWQRRSLGNVFLVCIGVFLLSITYRVSLDFYLNPAAVLSSSVVYFSKGYFSTLLILLLCWALVVWPLDKPKSDSKTAPEHTSPDALEPVARLGDVRPFTLTAYKGNKAVEVDVHTIQQISAAGNYMELHCGDAAYLLRATMKELEALLHPFNFVRIHRSHLINPKAILAVKADDTVELVNGSKLSISRRYKNNILSHQ